MDVEKPEYSFKEKFVNICRIPKEVLLGYSLVSIIGNSELTIENYRGIIEFNDEMIRVLGKIGQIKIHGKCLRIEYFTNDEMKVVGTIESIEYN